jgi:DNA-binding response OmpR family regulator
MNDAAPARILLVDDDEALGRYLARVLRRGGFDVTHELDSGDALHRIETESPSLIVQDFLPGPCHEGRAMKVGP